MQFSFVIILALIVIVFILYLRASHSSKKEAEQERMSELPEEVNLAKFCMIVKKVTSQKEVETVVEGKIVRGEVRVGDLLEICQVNQPSEPVAVEKIELLKPALSILQSTDDNVCLYLKGNISTTIEPKAVIISTENLQVD